MYFLSIMKQYPTKLSLGQTFFWEWNASSKFSLFSFLTDFSEGHRRFWFKPPVCWYGPRVYSLFPLHTPQVLYWKSKEKLMKKQSRQILLHSVYLSPKQHTFCILSTFKWQIGLGLGGKTVDESGSLWRSAWELHHSQVSHPTFWSPVPAIILICSSYLHQVSDSLLSAWVRAHRVPRDNVPSGIFCPFWDRKLFWAFI